MPTDVRLTKGGRTLVNLLISLETSVRSSVRAVDDLISLDRPTIRLEPDDVEHALRDARQELGRIVKQLETMRQLFDDDLPALLKRAKRNLDDAELPDVVEQLRLTVERQQRELDTMREQLHELRDDVSRIPRVVRSPA